MKFKFVFSLFCSILFLVGCSNYDDYGYTTSDKVKKKYDKAINQVINSENQYLIQTNQNRQLKRNTNGTGIIVYEDKNLIEIYYDESSKSKTAIYKKEGSKYIRVTYTKQIDKKIDSSQKKYVENIGIK